MESLKEIWASLRERYNHPLLYSFAISWLVLNYKAIVVLISNEKFVDKFEYIEQHLYPITASPLNNLLYFPLASSLIYVFVLPVISLASTWAEAMYERWHSTIRALVQRKYRLTKEQRDVLEVKVVELVTTTTREADLAKKSKMEAEASMQNYVEKIFFSLQPVIFFKLQQEAQGWGLDTEKLSTSYPHTGTAEQIEFVDNFGIPKQWAKVLKVGLATSISLTQTANKLDLDEKQTLNILFRLSALNMLKPTWSDNELHFSTVKSTYVYALNGQLM